MKTLKGIVKFVDIGIGNWQFVGEDGQKYQLIGGDDSLYKDGKKVKIRGKRRDDLVSSGNMGPIFEVDAVE